MKKTQYGGVKFQSVDQYHAAFSPEVRALLDRIRQIIYTVAPQAVEKISYNIPTFTLGKPLVHYGAYPRHIGFYPTPAVIEAFADKLSSFPTSKGAIQFRLDQPVPFDLIEQMVRFRKRSLCPDA